MTKWKIIFLSLFLIVWTSLKALFFALNKKHARANIDQLMRWWAKKTLQVVQVNYQIFNPHQVQFASGRSYVVMSNHASHYDIPLVYVAFPEGSIRMISKKELFRVPVWGHAMRASEVISIDRNNRRQAVKDLQIARDKIRSGIIPWIAPEGTRTRTGEMQPFKKGGFVLAIQTEATIIPMGIRGSGKILLPDTWDFNPGQKVEIHIGEPVNPKDYANVQELMAVVEKKVKSLVIGSSL